MLNKGDKVAICVCSDPLSPQGVKDVYEIKRCFKSFGLEPVCSPILEETEPIINEHFFQQRAEILQNFFLAPDVKAIFDVSGGDLANTVIDYLDFELIKANAKPFFGYSDLTVLLNALYMQTEQPMCLYTVRNLAREFGGIQRQRFKESILEGKNTLFDFEYRFLRGIVVEGIVVGGNIRCFLKLAGTPNFPEMQDKILFLESLGGEPYLLLSQLHQMKQIGIFKKIKGLVLGTFTNIEKNYSRKTVESIVLDVTAEYPFPVVSTAEIGHNPNAKALIIGQLLFLYKN